LSILLDFLALLTTRQGSAGHTSDLPGLCNVCLPKVAE